MTDYGRGPGSEPWPPEDPLFGDGYEPDHGYQPPPQHPQPQQQYPQQQHPQQYQQQDGGWQDPYATGQHPQYPQQGYPQQQYPQQPQYPQGQQPQYPQHPQQGYPQQANYDPYDTGSHQTGGYGYQDPYGGQQPQDPYGRPDFYGQNGYPPPQQPQYRQQPGPPQQGRPVPGQPVPGQPVPGQQMPGQPVPQQGAPFQQPGPGGPRSGHPQQTGAHPLETAPGDTGGWDADPEDDPREHAFFAGHDDEDDASSAAGGRGAGKSPKGGKKRRSGFACLMVAVVLVGAGGGVVYFGYTFYQAHFGPAPDYAGQGTATEVQVDIPTGATATTMGNILKQAGVVKSVDAFVSAANKNTKSRAIQAGVYVLNTQMSAAAAVTMMLDPKSQNAMIIPEGMRDQQVYALIDKRLGLAKGAAYKAAQAQVKNLGLPDWADTSKTVKDPLEGFLFPSRYSVAKGMKPDALLRQMVGEAKKQYAQFDMAAEAKKQGLNSPLQLLTVASLVQAEGKTGNDFRQMAKVVYNRLSPSNSQTNGLLQFDSTYNYIKNANQTNIATKDIQSLNDTYNTYKFKGLPPGPIGNPGINALKAAMDPDSGNWWYFISLDGKTTQFTQTLAEFNKLKTTQGH
jgi:UPF0755 protein